MSSNDSASDGSLDKIMPQSAVEIPTAVGPHLTHGQNVDSGQQMVTKPQNTNRGGSSRGR